MLMPLRKPGDAEQLASFEVMALPTHIDLQIVTPDRG